MSTSRRSFTGVTPGETKIKLYRNGTVEDLEVGGFRTVKDPQVPDASPEQFTLLALGKSKDTALATAGLLGLGAAAPDCTYTSRKTKIVIDQVEQPGEFFVLVGEGKFKPFPRWQADFIYIADREFKDVDTFAGKLWDIRTVEAKEIFRIFGTNTDGTVPGATP